MQYNRWIKWLLVAVVTVMMSACGGGNGPGATAQDIAIAKIVAYAESNGITPAPTEDDYIDAGVDLNGVDTDDINDYIATLDTTQVDSEEDIQQIVDDVGVWLVDTDGDGQKNYADEDDDGDGVSDVEEESTGSDPLDMNSTSHNGFVYKVVLSPYTGKQWLDRNLGARQICTAYNDTSCYGDYYQWGRRADGHEKSANTNSTDVLADNVDNVGHSDFITAAAAPRDWTDAVTDANGSHRAANWSKTDGSSVCPVGFRVPTVGELEAELTVTGTSAEIEDRDDAFNSFLKLPSAGIRDLLDASLDGQGSWGEVWASSVGGSFSDLVHFDAGVVYLDGAHALGLSVRCLRD